MVEALKYYTVLSSRHSKSSACPGTESGAVFPSSHVASVPLSTQSIFLVGLFFFSEHFKVRLSLLLQLEVLSNHF